MTTKRRDDVLTLSANKNSIQQEKDKSLAMSALLPIPEVVENKLDDHTPNKICEQKDYNLNDNKKLANLENYIKKKKLPSEKVKLYFCRCCKDKLLSDRNSKSFLIGEKLLESDFNIIHIIKKLIDIDKIKTILFDKPEIEGLKMMKRPRQIDPNSSVDKKVEECEDLLKFREEYDINYMRNLFNNLVSLRNYKDNKVYRSLSLEFEC